jgi:AraC-like DNA-binding protein
MGVTEIKVERDGFGLTDPMPYTNAAMLAVQLRAIPFHEAMTDGKAVPVYDIRPGDTLFYDMRRDPQANVMTPSHSLHFVLPSSLLDDVAAMIGSHRIEGLFPPTGAVVHDRHLARLATAILPSLHAPTRTTALFTSHFTLALGIYACWRYGGMQAPRQPAGELCVLQTRLATEYISANLDGGIELGELAAVCGMPLRHFIVAFRDTFGMAPHQWLALRRIDMARSLLEGGQHELSEIASASGFIDEPHLVESFTRAIGATPLNYLAQLD